jgi:hypothetical protein
MTPEADFRAREMREMPIPCGFLQLWRAFPPITNHERGSRDRRLSFETAVTHRHLAGYEAREEVEPGPVAADALAAKPGRIRRFAGMAELTLEMIRALFRAELAPLRAELGPLRAELAPLRARMDEIAATVEAMRPNIEGIPVLHRAIGTIHQEQRMMKAAINEIARRQFTSSQVEALHADVNAVQARHMELETRILTLEREIKETKRTLEGTNEAVEALKRR